VDVIFTSDEYNAIRQAFHVAMLALHYANKDHTTGLNRNDPNITSAIAEVGRTYRVVKSKLPE
jgi:hypothetical protein